MKEIDNVKLLFMLNNLKLKQDKSNSIDKVEWLKYLSCIDKITGNLVFKPELRKLF